MGEPRLCGRKKIQRKQNTKDDNDIPHLIQNTKKTKNMHQDNDIPDLIQKKKDKNEDNDMPTLVRVTPPPKICAICSSQKDLFRCSRCKSIYYCTQKHQKQH